MQDDVELPPSNDVFLMLVLPLGRSPCLVDDAMIDEALVGAFF